MSEQRDLLARCAFSHELSTAAERFLVDLFGRGYACEVDGAAVNAAMTIVCGLSWIQPTAEQLKAIGIWVDDGDVEGPDDPPAEAA